MKKLTMLLLAAFSLSASAQTKTTTSTNTNTTQTVTDDGKTLHISINSSKNGKEIKYKRTFTVAGMSAAQRNALVKKITDSLGVSQPPPPPAPHTMTTALTSPKTNTTKSESKQTVKDNGKTLHVNLSESKQTVKDNGKTLHLNFSGSKNGKEVKYNHTYAVAGMSKQQKEALVNRVTDSLQAK